MRVIYFSPIFIKILLLGKTSLLRRRGTVSGYTNPLRFNSVGRHIEGKVNRLAIVCWKCLGGKSACQHVRQQKKKNSFKEHLMKHGNDSVFYFKDDSSKTFFFFSVKMTICFPRSCKDTYSCRKKIQKSNCRLVRSLGVEKPIRLCLLSICNSMLLQIDALKISSHFQPKGRCIKQY